MKYIRLPGFVTCLASLLPLASAVAAPPPLAAGGARAPTPAGAYAEECGACHVAYPARFLRTSQWLAVLTALDEHFGVDATVDPATLALVARHLGAASGVPHPGAVPVAMRAGEARPSPADSPLPRISTQPWFVREHREARGLRGADKPSQCDVCHTDAARGRFDEPGEEHEHDRD